MDELAQTVAVLGGARLPLSPGSSKMLRYMLERPEGCDAWLTPARFIVQYGWHLAHHPYFPDVVPSLASWLLDALGVRHGVESASGIVRAGRLPAVEDYVAWAHGPRAVWVDLTPGKITFVVREATSLDVLATRPQPLEPPIEYVVATRCCPHCGLLPERYRKLSDGALVCLACGASARH